MSRCRVIPSITACISSRSSFSGAYSDSAPADEEASLLNCSSSILKPDSSFQLRRLGR